MGKRYLMESTGMLALGRKLMRSFTAGEASQGMVECGFVIALIALAAVPFRSLAENFVAMVRIVELLLSSI